MAFALLASAGGLAIAIHDGLATPVVGAATALGETATAKGDATVFLAPPTADWAAVRLVLGNATYIIGTGDAATVVLATGADLHADAGNVIVRGPVLLRAPHPDGSGRLLVILAVTSWDTPILFG